MNNSKTLGVDFTEIANIHDPNVLEQRMREFNEKAKSVSEQFAKEASRIRQEERERRRKAEEEFRTNLAKELCQGHECSLEQAKLIVDRAWDEGHSGGFNEVRIHAESLADFADEIIKIQIEIDY